jgi:hypothetical protein
MFHSGPVRQDAQIAKVTGRLPLGVAQRGPLLHNVHGFLDSMNGLRVERCHEFLNLVAVFSGRMPVKGIDMAALGDRHIIAFAEDRRVFRALDGFPAMIFSVRERQVLRIVAVN